MFSHLIAFEWQLYARKLSFLVILLLSLLFGLLIATSARFAFPGTNNNSPYNLSYLCGIGSLICNFLTSLLVAQILFREKDNRMEGIVYTLPIRKLDWMASRFLMVFGITALSFMLLLTGILTGYETFPPPDAQMGQFKLHYYLQPFLLLVLPNIFFCSALLCAVAWSTRNKLLVYLTGIFLYFSYWTISLFTNSPLMAGNAPVTGTSMSIAALLDPFGISAFFEQTRYWTPANRNSRVLLLQGNLLGNRLLVLALSLLLLILSHRNFSFRMGSKQRRKPFLHLQESKIGIGSTETYRPVDTTSAGWWYYAKSILSLLKLDLKFMTKSIPFLLACTGFLCFFSIETWDDLNGNSRISDSYASTGRLVSNLLKSLPLFTLMILTFFGSEITWLGKSSRFDALELSSPFPRFYRVYSKFLALGAVSCLLLALGIVASVIIQLAKGNSAIDFPLYGSLLYIIGYPLMLAAGIITAANALLPNKYLALAVSALLVTITSSSLPALFGITHPLVRFTSALRADYSDITGWTPYLKTLFWKNTFGTGILLLLFLVAGGFRSFRKPGWYLLLAGALGLTLLGAGLLVPNLSVPSRQTINDQKRNYELSYRKYENLAQPTILAVDTRIDLFPESCSYRASGQYQLVNHQNTPIDSLLVFQDPDMQDLRLDVKGGRKKRMQDNSGHRFILLDMPLQPGDSLNLKFSFGYTWPGYKKNHPSNTIVKNGSFIRISNYYPVFGYQFDREISDPLERKKRNLPPPRRLPPADDSSSGQQAEQFVQFNSILSTSSSQTAIGVGELAASWQKSGRNYFQYHTKHPIPFRFAVSSAELEVKQTSHRGHLLEAWYHPEHKANIDHLLENARVSLDYCESNFGKYPFQSLRLVEVSAFAEGPAGTAYPNTIYNSEAFGFRNQINADPERDILTEMVAHEISHSWWGNTQIAPHWGEGSKLLTETLAMYTELMIYKKMYGPGALPKRVSIHEDIYLAARSMDEEEALYKAHPDKAWIFYHKGMVAMYRLYLLLGEEKINQALRLLLLNHRWPLPPPTSLDLLKFLHEVSEPAFHARIDSLLKSARFPLPDPPSGF